MVQSQMSRLKLTKMITVMPFYLVVNHSTRTLRYMEENKNTDLWFDLSVGQVRGKGIHVILLFKSFAVWKWDSLKLNIDKKE